MTNTRRWTPALATSLLVPLHAHAAAPAWGLHSSAGLVASLVAVLGMVALASGGAWGLSWYGARQRLQRREALATGAKPAPRLVLVPTEAVQTAASPLAEVPAAAPSGRRAQAVRSRRPALTALRGFGQPSQIGSQFGHLN